MNCRRCNTPLPSRASSCPNCGQHVGAGESFIDDPGDGEEIEASSDELMSPSPLSPTESDEEEEEEEEDLEVDLDDEVEIEMEELSLDEAVATEKRSSKDASSSSARPARSSSASTSKPSSSKSMPDPGASASTMQKRSATRAEPNRPRKPMGSTGSSGPASSSGARARKEGRSPATRGSASPSAVLPDPDTVRSILAQQPELIEPGLEVLADETGQEIGIHHATEVGVIDLLARDSSGSLVAVMVVGSESSGDLIAEALHRLGWVRKHLAKDGENVRGVVLTDRLDDEEAYAAAAVSGTLQFKSYALSLSLRDIDV